MGKMWLAQKQNNKTDPKQQLYDHFYLTGVPQIC